MQKEIKDFKKENAGRSMTEMLGVLAIIGVLSVGGITGYKLAMNRYAANQIAYEINILRNDVKSKLVRGIQKLVFEYPYDLGYLKYDSNYEFDGYCVPIPENCENAIGYEFIISNIPGNICPILNKLFINMGGKVDINTLNGKDESNKCQEENNIFYVVFEIETPVCSGNKSYWNGKSCVGCPDGEWDERNKQCICPEGTEWNEADGGECISNPCGKCDAGKFCLSTGCNSGCAETTNCTFECVFAEGEKNGNYVMSRQVMNWWSAERFCQAQQKRMMTISELHCKDIIQYGVQCGNNTSWGYCHTKGSEKLCSEPSDTDVSDVVAQLRETNSNWFWLKDAYDSNQSRTSCRAYGVRLDNGNIGNNGRWKYNNIYALCVGDK